MRWDKKTEYNHARWEELAREEIIFSRPWKNLTADNAKQKLDHQDVLSDVSGKKVLCLASGGGQQSVAFALLGAEVTVLDFSETQLSRDDEAARSYDVKIRTIHGDMRDLSAFNSNEFDIVWQPPSINNVRESRLVISEVARVLKTGGFYLLEFANPFTKGMDERSWNGSGYLMKRFYLDGEEINPDDEAWEIWDEAGNCKIVEGPRQYRHSLSNIFNALTDNGFIVSKFWEEIGDFAAKSGTWDHFTAVAPAILGVWCKLIRQMKQKVDLMHL